MEAKEVLHFWFEEIAPKLWFQNDGSLDEKIKQQFSDVYHQATKGELWRW